LVGVPLTTPVELKFSPAGKAPEETIQISGNVPPVAANVWLNAVPYVAVVRRDAVEITGAAFTVIVSLALVTVSGLSALSVTDHVNVFTPVVPLTVPLRNPVDEFSATPVGRVPVATYVPYGSVPPETCGTRD